MPRRRTRTVSIINATTGNRTVVKSAARVLQILEIFDDVQREMRVGEIAEHTGYPQSSASVLLRSLANLGYLDFDATSRTYRPTARVALLGAWTSDAIANGAVIRLMERLSEETGATITLATRNGIYAQYIHVLQATSTMRLHTPTGTKRLLVWSAAGFALLHDAAKEEILRLVHRTNAEQDQRKLDPAQILTHIETFRRQGYFYSRELVTPGGGHISMTLPASESRRERPMAIGVSGWVEDLDREEARIVKAMKRAVLRRGM